MAGATVTNPEEGSLENRVSTMAGQAIEAWRARGLDGTVPSPRGGEMPATMAAGILSIEFLVHAWDLGQASGNEVVVSDEVVPTSPGSPRSSSPAAAVPRSPTSRSPAADAGALERLAAYSGRTPVSA